jgi:hypothetical protein
MTERNKAEISEIGWLISQRKRISVSIQMLAQAGIFVFRGD